MLFGVNVSTSSDSDPVSAGRKAEELGFDFVSANDHLHGTHSRYETWTMLSWIAAATSRIQVASRVLAVPYRHPAVLAKMAESFDRLSGGRLILGMGGGYSDEEFLSFGLGQRSARDKVDGMQEAVRIVRGLWSERSFTFGGRLYRTDGAELEPKPERRIPIWLGTYGPRALAVTGRLADGWIPTFELAPPEQVSAMRDRVLAAAWKAGREPEEITCVYNLDIRIDERGDLPPSVVSGSAEALTDRLVSFTAMGFTAFNLCPAGPGEDEQVERLAREVIPAVRSAASIR
jgi:alkanesulfonate monooxygenase SsuD/methylene tetrahydromethanopterin reductase-like flavin-dependent oxidoreductase (luciferase family)